MAENSSENSQGPGDSSQTDSIMSALRNPVQPQNRKKTPEAKELLVKQVYSGFGLNPFPLMIFFSLYVVIIGAILLGRGFESPSVSGATQIYYSFYLTDMKFGRMQIRIIREWYTLDPLDPTQKVLNTAVQTSTPIERDYYWELGAVTLPFSVETTDAYSITVEYGLPGFRYNTSFSLSTTQIGSGIQLLRPKSLVLEARPSFTKRYLTPHATGEASAYVGILDVPILVYHYQDKRIKRAFSNGKFPRPLKHGIIVFSIGIFLSIITAIGVQFGLSYDRQKKQVRWIYERQTQTKASSGAGFIRKFNRENRNNFMINRYPPLMYE